MNQDNYDYRRGTSNDAPAFQYATPSSLSQSHLQMSQGQHAPQPQPGQFGQPAQPATPRMLRSVSGSLKNSRSDVNMDKTLSPSPRPEEFAQYVTSNTYRSHSRNPSFQQQQAYDVNQITPNTPGHKRQVSSNTPLTPNNAPRQVIVTPQNQQAGIPSTLNPKVINQNAQQQLAGSGVLNNGELLPPVSMHTPLNSNAESTIDSKLSVKKQHPPPTGQRQAPTTPQTPGNKTNSHHHAQQPQQPFHRKSIGDWAFMKTIGAGSMGKVKLARHNSTGEICAVKIVPRAAKLYQRAHQDDPPPQTQQELEQKQKEFDKEIARDKRTTREGALGRLLFHPYVCRLYEIVSMTNHYYMLFEYVEGGQMLDYIVAHGSLKEKNARKFARGIASALDYCHKNNVVHRDLKIENIMINQKGDIKIIDFGLSNLYNPKSLLKTYCGSLYFAAPELLCARPYTGPEVDIWSFGVVLYVLVCGKVPFDDQSVSVLHEKIKKGNVEYPASLSKDCVSLLTRMLQVDPLKRATLYEVINHPWMNKGYEYAISSHIPRRIPLTLPLDPDIIKTIASFDLGNFQSLSEDLTNIVGSAEYHMSTENWYRLAEQGREYASASNAHILPDPTGGFHPLISIYYLVDEMRKRKKAKEEAVKLQLQEVERKRLQQEHANQQSSGAGIITQQPKPHSIPQIAVPLQGPPPPIAFPEQAHTSPSHRKSASPTDYDSSNSVLGAAIPPEQQPHSPIHEASETNGKNINSLLRRLSGKRGTRAGVSPQRGSDSSSKASTPDADVSPSRRDPMVRRGVSMKVTAKEKSDPRTNRIAVVDKEAQRNEAAQKAEAQKAEAQRAEVQRAEVQRAEAQKAAGKDSKRSHNRSQSINVSNNKHGFVPVEYLPPLPQIDTHTNLLVPGGKQPTKSHPTARSKSLGGHYRRESQGGRVHGGAHPPLPNHLADQNSDELVNADGSKKEEVGIYDGFFDDILLDDEDAEYHEIPRLTEDEIIEQFNNAKPNTMLSIEYPKTLFLKGFFSVQTTSTKSLPVIRYNIISVLSRLGVKFQEVKGGFVCSHTASVEGPLVGVEDDVDDIIDNPTESFNENEINQRELEEDKLYGDAFKSTSTTFDEQSKSPVSLEGNSGNQVSESTITSNRSRGPSRQPSLHLNTQNLATPKGHHKQSSSISSTSSGGGHRRKFSIGNSILRKKSFHGQPPNTPAAARLNKLLYGEDFDDDYEEEMKRFTEDDSVDSVSNIMIGGGSDMLMSSRLEHRSKNHKVRRSPLKFEIHVVKFPLVGLYGVQFKKLLGNTWNYKTLASQILNELKL